MTVDEGPIDVRALTRRLRMHPYTGAVTNISVRTTVGATPGDVYATLLDAERHSTVTGRSVHITPTVGTAVSLSDESINGYITELLDSRHIVMALCFADERWPAEHYSTVTFMLKPDGAGSTLVIFEQDVPEELADKIASTWQGEYVDTLRSAFPPA
jgi:activator of HSP90 ATPase